MIPKDLTFYSDIKIIEAAPSLTQEEFAAVIVPVLLNAGESWEIFASLYFFGSSSSLIYSSPVLDFIITEAISCLNIPFLLAAIALW